jgi:predicted AAA+ superfamily ATPase
MESSTLKSAVADWLRGPALPALTPRDEPIPGLSLEMPRPILSIVGPRRAGKTYFLFQLIGNLLNAGRAFREDILFIDFEDFRLRDFAPEDMDRLLTAFVQLAGRLPRYLFFDEIQNLPSWSRVIRTLHNTRRYSIVVTGSNASLLGSEISTELRGRYEDALILPFSFREFLSFRKIDASAATLATPESGLIRRAFDDYLQSGGFPEVAAASDEGQKRRLLQTYFDTTFYKDILDRHGIRARDLLAMLMRNLLESYGATFSISAFEKQLKGFKLPGSKRSVANYLRLLEEAFFVIGIEKFDYSPRKRAMNPKKVYLMDSGFSLLGGAFSENKGRWLENVVAVELFRRRRRMMYFKNKGECDFIVQKGVRPETAWQVCWDVNEANEKRELRGFVEAKSLSGVQRGGILTYDQEGRRTEGGVDISLQPVWKWLLGNSPADPRFE